ncbi:cyclic di-GMP phosphodiesterase Gmr [Clostridium homopropionicum DSM 5847]|uniref:Cyclic di-GMP phosphodiesterase Gmr n=1 Tax=Clostridium homopropionicum DSM 5847 TaxID=1121318 RepID=A0A0L6Z8T1_9CLOT|nr:EAL domain-containing protein [Clostridium homopropionicum]KOA19374.1 cyclic di-GMP phosphodiesterase Gmr [Clostridium homopropionicum DSM 5847]SFG67825.1 PAS domain S-box-containing protein/diguanylate cyclase (GGDEF) domain-containing protein [Clostridium homopropionicum]
MGRKVWKKASKILLFIIIIIGIFPEKAIAERQVVKYQGEIDYPPYKYINKGQYTGFDISLTNLIFRNDDYSLEYSNDKFDLVYERLKNGQIDTCGMLAVNDERKKEVLFSDPIITLYCAIYTRNNFQKINIDNMENFTIGVGDKQYSEELLRNSLGIYNYTTYESPSSALDALQSGKIDVLFENQDVINYLIIEKGLKDDIIHQQQELFPTKLAYAISKSNEPLVDYINNRLKLLIKSGVYEEVYQKYFFTHSDIYRDRQQRKVIFMFLLISIIILIGYFIIGKYIKHLRKKIGKEQEFSNTILNEANIFIFAINKGRKIIKLNKYAETIMGIKYVDFIGKLYEDIINISEFLSLIEDVLQKVERKDTIKSEQNLSFIVGEIRHKFLFKINVIRLNKDYEIVFMGIDITERIENEEKLETSYKDLEASFEEISSLEEELREKYEELSLSEANLRKSKEFYQLITEASYDAIWDWDIIDNKSYFSDRWYEFLGYDEEEERNPLVWRDLIHLDDVQKVNDTILNHWKNKTELFKIEYRIRAVNGEYIWIQSVGKTLFDREGKPYRLVGSHKDITEIKRYQEKLENLAYTDYLTKLPNREYMYNKIKNDFVIKNGINELRALFHIDVDNFKYLNDTMGHAFGDSFIVAISERLKTLVDEDKCLIRVGGDSFIFCIKNISNCDEIENFAKGIMNLINQPFDIKESIIQMTISIGIAVWPKNGISMDELLKKADLAMYSAKGSGKNRYTFFDEIMDKELIERVKIEKHLRNAIENDEFELYYQPQVDINLERTVGFEALIRWNSPELGFVSPLRFIKIAEENHMIIEIGTWVLETACNFIKEIHNQGNKDCCISVNVSVLQLIQQDFVQSVLNILEEVELNPQYLVIEITESICIEYYESICEKLNRLRAEGIKVALDDFGKGYSSLSYLKQLPIDMLKIDKSFIDDLEDKEGKSLVENIIMIGHKMGYSIVAEGVETNKQNEYLKEFSCDKVQGFYFSKPVPREEALNRHR